MGRDFVEGVTDYLSPLERLLGKDNMEDVKKEISQIIVNAVRIDIADYKRQTYVFYPPDYIKGIAEEAFDEVEKKIKKMYKDAMFYVAERSVQKYKELTIADLVKESDEREKN